MKRAASIVAAVVSTALAAPTLAAAQTVAGTAPLRTAGASPLGAAQGTRTATLVLQGRDPAGLRAFLADAGHPRLTPAQYTARFGPTRATVRALRTWAAAHRLSLTLVPDGVIATVRGSTAALGSALGVGFERFGTPAGQSYVSSTGRAALPRALAGAVRAIVGLSDLGHLALAQLHQSTTVLGGYTPQDFNSIYHAPAQETGAGQALAIITAGDLTHPRTDLQTFERQFHLPTVQWNEIEVGTPPTDTSNDDEWDLDSQYSTAFAPDVTALQVYNASSLNDPDILAAMQRWVSDDLTAQASFSGGECELLAQASGFLAGEDAVLAQAAAQGQTLFASSGDTGGFCPALVAVNGVPLGLPGPNYPACSPYAIGVGGTTLLGPPLPEIGWIAGGGGVSLLEPVPQWQAGAGGTFLGIHRGVPDVALDADSLTGYQVIVDGQPQIVGGTSASAPSWQGIWARAQGAHGGSLGFAGPVIYQTEPASAFHDITLGVNVPYIASPGWDYLTGRGTPDIAAFVAGA
jgi:subtilase family serine protease